MLTSRQWILPVLLGVSLGVAGRFSSGWWLDDSGHGGGVLAAAGGEGSGDSPARNSSGQADLPKESAPRGGLESVEGILAATGFERAERLGRFLVTAGPADLERLALGLRGETGNIEMTLGDAVFLRWMTIDAEGGLAFAERERFGSMAWWAWGKTDPDSALAAALGKPSPWNGEMVMRAIAQSDPLRARGLFERYPQFAESSAMGGLASGMMKVDPAAGASLATAWNHAVDHENLVSGWARREPQAALDWANALPDLTKRKEALEVVFGQLAAAHPEMVRASMEALPEGQTKWRLYAEHAKRLATTDLDAARAWVEAAPTTLLQKQATVELARGLAASDPTAALEALRRVEWSVDPESFTGEYIMWPNGSSFTGGESQLANVVAEISAVAPVQCLDFVASLPVGVADDSLVSDAFNTWMGSDSLAASEWLAGQPDGMVRQVATRQLVASLINGPDADFASAAHWALTLPGNRGREGEVRRVFEQWSHRDHEAAQAFLDQPDCPPGIHAVIDSLPPSP